MFCFFDNSANFLNFRLNFILQILVLFSIQEQRQKGLLLEMAKVGESDQRWIVEARSDGKNVGNWHWSEKSVLNDAEERFKEVLKNIDIPCDGATLTLTKVVSVTGDMNLMNRKRTIRFIYDATVNFVWRGVILVDGVEVKGHGKLAVYDVDNSQDFQYRVTMEKEKPENRVLKNFVKNNAPSVLNPMIKDIVDTLTEEYTSQSEIEQEPSSETPTNSPVISNFNSTVIPSQDNVPTMTLTTVRQTVRFNCRAEDLYLTLTDPQRISAFTASPCNFEPTVGSEFTLLDGVVSGKIVKLDQNKKLVWKWRFSDWDEDHFSHLIIKLEESSGKTKLTLIQKKVPSSDSSRTLQGWEIYFWRRIRGMFGWSYTILK